jgi:hypothetical protein
VQALTRASGYRRWGPRAATALGVTADSQWRFALDDADGDGAQDLFAMRVAGAPRAELHILSGAGGYTRWLLHTLTPLDAPAAAWGWATFSR